jgi:hypothetical protein
MVKIEVKTVVVTMTVPIDVDIAIITDADMAGIKASIVQTAIAAANGMFSADDVLTVFLRQTSKSGQIVSGRHRRNNPINVEIVMKETTVVDSVAIAISINAVVEVGKFIVTATIEGKTVTVAVIDAVAVASKTVTIVTSVVVPIVVDGPLDGDNAKAKKSKLAGAMAGVSVLLVTVVGVALLIHSKQIKTKRIGVK